MASVRGEGPKTLKTRKVKMSEKRVFSIFQIVQGPGFSCKPNIAFFMGYPLYRMEMGVFNSRKLQMFSFVIFYCLLVLLLEYANGGALENRGRTPPA